MEAAARRPAATASMIVRGPDTTSPPAKIPARPVARVRGSATIPAQPLTSMPAPSGRMDGSGSSPMATRIALAGSSRISPVEAQLGAAGRGGVVGRAHDVAANGDHGPVAADDLVRREAFEDHDALALGRLDLLGLGGHVAAPPAIDDGHGGRAAPACRPRRVHRGAAAADDDDVARQSGRLAEVDLLEEPGCRDDPAQLVAGDPEASALGRAGREEDRPEPLALEVGQAEVPAHRGVQPQLDPDREDPRDLLRQHLARQPVFGNADRHHAAGHGHRLEHGDGVPEAGEVPGRRHAGRPAADDRHPLGAAHRRRLDRGKRALLRREALQGPDRDRFVQHASTACDLARRGADPAAHRREGVDLGGDGVRLVVAAGPDQAHVPSGVGAGGARLLAGSERTRWRVVDHRRPDLPLLGPRPRPPGEQVAPRRVVDGLERLAGDLRQRDPSVGRRFGRAVDRTLPSRERHLAGHRDQRHHVGRAFADADAAADALAHLERVLHHPRERVPGARARFDARGIGTAHVQGLDRAHVHADPARDAPAMVDVDPVAHQPPPCGLTSIRSGAGSGHVRPGRRASRPIEWGARAVRTGPLGPPDDRGVAQWSPRRPSRTARATASARLWAWSLSRMLRRWNFTVFSEMPSVAAISLFR